MNELNRKTRIKVKIYLPAVSYVICLQRKKWYGWLTVSWIYPSIVKNESCKYIEDWLFWKETYKKETKSERTIGKNIIKKCEW